jgi:hypothetical protein
MNTLKWLLVSLGLCAVVIGCVVCCGTFADRVRTADQVVPPERTVVKSVPVKPVGSKPGKEIDYVKEFGDPEPGDSTPVKPVPSRKVSVATFALIGALAVGTVGFAVYGLRRSRRVFRDGFASLIRWGRFTVSKVNWGIVARAVCGMIIGGCIFGAGCWWIREASKAAMVGQKHGLFVVRWDYDLDTRKIVRNLALVGVLLGGTVGLSVYGFRRKTSHASRMMAHVAWRAIGLTVRVRWLRRAPISTITTSPGKTARAPTRPRLSCSAKRHPRLLDSQMGQLLSGPSCRIVRVQLACRVRPSRRSFGG